MLSSSLYEAVFNSSLIGNYLLSPTPEAIILAVNDAFLKASSRRREELVGISLFVAFPGNPDDPEDTGEVALRNSLAEAIATGQPKTMPVQRYPIRMELPNGEIGYEERFWSAINTPIFGENGQILCVSHSTSDITEKVRAEGALRESEKRFRALVNATTDVVYRMGPDWTLMRQLEGRGFLKNTFDPHQFWVDDYIPREEQELVHRSIEKAIRDKSIFELEHRVRRVDGTYGWTYSRAAPMLDGNGEIYEWIGAATDITERKRTEEELKQANQRKDEFLAMLAHELRNPLAPISAAVELLQIANLDEALVRKTSQVIGRQVEHMTGLVDDLLDVSRVTRGMVELDNAPLDVGSIVSDAIEQVTPLIRSRRHHFRLQLAPDATLVMGDKKRLVQVITNLLNNAAKYTHEGGNIVVKTDVRQTHVLVEVIDDGIGMAPELAVRAFDLFAQAERSSDRSLGGLGLGLALVKSLVELHHGTVTCESPGLGKGSKFSVCLPVLLDQSGLISPESVQNCRKQTPNSLRILVVDDNVDAAWMLAMLLEAQGHQVLVEHGSYQALERARAEAPNVCLLDIGLPGMDGHELAQRLHAQAETAKSVLIAVTGYDQENDRQLTHAAGFNHHLVKPVDMRKLAAILAEISKS
jgi:signal transduction histidine kinase/CheY-like chemotaxis protein